MVVMKPVCLTSGVALDHWVEVGSAGFFHCKATTFPIVVNKFLGRYFETVKITFKDPLSFFVPFKH